MHQIKITNCSNYCSNGINYIICENVEIFFKTIFKEQNLVKEK